MSETSDNRKRLFPLIVLLLAVGGVTAWSLTRNPQGPDDATKEKAEVLQSILEDAKAEQRKQPEPPPPPEPASGPKDIRSGG